MCQAKRDKIVNLFEIGDKKEEKQQ